MIAIKTNMTFMPQYCEMCRWYGSRPHPMKGWTNLCELMGECMDDDVDEGWEYDGGSRPANCPLVEVKGGGTEYERSVDQLEHDILYEPTFNPEDGSM